MHKQHTQSLIAVIKQLNLEQQLLMWRVGVLAGSMIITRINTHTCTCKQTHRHIHTAQFIFNHCLPGMFILKACMCACESACTCKCGSICMGLISLHNSLSNIPALTYFHILSEVQAWPSVHVGVRHRMCRYIKACVWVYIYTQCFWHVWKKHAIKISTRKTEWIYHK